MLLLRPRAQKGEEGSQNPGNVEEVEKNTKRSMKTTLKRGCEMFLNKNHLFSRALLLMAALLIGCICFAETHVSSPAAGIWDEDGSPYIITGDVTISAGNPLVIFPGTQVVFQGHYQMYVAADAVLKAIGTEDEPIVFTAEDTIEGHGGIWFDYSSDACSLSYCNIEYGKATGYFPIIFGGAILCYDSNPTIMNCKISNCSAIYGYGGGIACYYASPIIKNNVITDNSALYSGGGIVCMNSNATIEGNIIARNWTGGNGGGISLNTESSLRVVNNIIYSNIADSIGGGIDCYSASNAVLINNTIIENHAGLSGGAISCSYASNPKIFNTIIWNNTSPDSIEFKLFSTSGYGCEVAIAYSNLDLEKCNVETGSELNIGLGMVNSAPEFEDTLFYPSPTSSVIDAGIGLISLGDSTLYAPAYDIFGRPRPAGEGWDIGACEFQPHPQMEISPTELIYGDVEVMTTEIHSISMVNNGSDDLIVFDIHSTNSSFAVSETYLMLSPDSSVEVEVSFTPDISGLYDDTLWICSNADTQFVLLQGLAISPANMVLSDSIVDFGIMMEGAAENAILIVSNTGDLDLEVHSVYTSVPDFEVSDVEFVVPAGEGLELRILFTPEEVRIYSETLWICSNVDTHFVLLCADVRQKPIISLSDSLIEFESIPLDSTVTVTITVANIGGWELMVDNISTTNPVFSVSTDFLSPIEPGASNSFVLSVTLDNYGEYSGTLWVYSEFDTAFVELYARASSGIVMNNEKPPDNVEVSVYPNPFNSYVVIEVNEENSMNSVIEIFDINGHKIDELSPGENVWHAERSIPSGTYFVRVVDCNLRRSVIYSK